MTSGQKAPTEVSALANGQNVQKRSSSLAKVREIGVKKTASLEIPLEWQLSSIAAADNALSRKSDRRTRDRLVRHAERMASK